MIRLGSCDAGCRPEDLDAYFDARHEAGMRPRNQLRGERLGEWVGFRSAPGRQVRNVQRFLKKAGFFPHGRIDGICGYRTTSSMRLFQEYIRSVESDPSIGAPDGIFGRKSLAHVERWQRDGVRADWTAYGIDNPQPDYRNWMRLLARVQRQFQAHPTDLLRRIDRFAGATDTRPVGDWDYDPSRIHLLGIRRHEAKPGKRTNDDVFILLVNGLVFRFYGTTDPGKSSHRAGAPFLVRGQHRYRFGWHKQSDRQKVYRALKPRSSGVLVVRDADRNYALTESDRSGRLENNASINVHWGGRGVSNWSQGCQVICGRGYINHNGDIVDCGEYAATTYATLGRRVDGRYQTKGAYSVLVDLVTAFSGDELSLEYTLLYEQDLAIDAGFGRDAAAKINAVMHERLA
ncbi:MAG: hypothetical protein QNJ91_03845 [Gammaproteobacteria bacterium]|nr:hypothetical protein [Gammaproteobacteria bacterium]